MAALPELPCSHMLRFSAGIFVFQDWNETLSPQGYSEACLGVRVRGKEQATGTGGTPSGTYLGKGGEI